MKSSCFFNTGWIARVTWILFLVVSFVSNQYAFGQVQGSDKNPIEIKRLIGNSLKGEAVNFSDLLGKEGKAVCFTFLHPNCPLAQKYAPVLSELASEFGKQGVKMVGVVCEFDDLKEITDYQTEFSLTFPILTDREFQMAQELDATVTPEAVLVDSTGRVRYRGRIDNRYKKRGEQTPLNPVPELKNAILDVLAGREIKEPLTTAAGCPLDRPEIPSVKPKTNTTVTFYRDILPFLNRNCQKCHSPNNAAPFSLMTYEDTVEWLELGIEEMEAHRMPPAQIESDFDFIAARSTSATDLAKLKLWVENGMPKGDPASVPPLEPLPDNDHFDPTLGPPDLVIRQPVPTELGPKGKDLYRYIIFPLNLPNDTYVRAIQFLPGNRRIVHHTLIAHSPHDLCEEAVKKYGQYDLDSPGDKAGGYYVSDGIGFRIPLPDANGQPKVALIGDYVPGSGTVKVPEGSVLVIPAGSDIQLQMHYSRTGKQETDSSQIAIWFDKSAVFKGQNAKKKVQFLFMSGDFSVIPAGVKDFRIRAEYILPCDAELFLATPHAHYLARWIEIRYQKPGDDKPKLLLRVPRWDFNWQASYDAKRVIPFPAGTRFEVEASYDNTSSNPLNPNVPPKPVWHAESSADEMLLPMLNFVAEKSFDPYNQTTEKFTNILVRASFLKRLVDHNNRYVAKPDGSISISPKFQQ